MNYFAFTRSSKPIARTSTGKNIYLHVKAPADVGMFTSLDDPCMQLFPEVNPKQVSSILVTGTKGVGKSYWCAQFVKFWTQVFDAEKQDVILFRRQKKVDDINRAGCTEINIDERFGDNKPKRGQDVLPMITIDDLKDPENPTLIVFDDVESIMENDRRVNLNKLRSAVCQDGRDLKLHVLNVLHDIKGGKPTVGLVMESEIKVVFPDCIDEKMEKNYSDIFTKKQIEAMRDFRGVSQWMAFNRSYPRWCVHEKGVFLLD